MGKQRTIRQYRALDLFLFAAMLVFFEALIHLASTSWFPSQPWTVSLTPAITAVVLIRWGPWGGIHAVLGALVLCLVSMAQPVQYAVYLLGNLFALLALPALKLFGGKGEITARSDKTVLFGLLVLALMQGGRALTALALGYLPTLALGFFTTEVVTDLFTLLILWIVRRLDGMLEDQRSYLRRIAEEEEQNAAS